MNILGAVNHFYPNTIRKLALDQEHLPDGIPYMDVFIELFDGAMLPPSLTTDQQTAYNTSVTQQTLLSALAAHRYAVQNGGVTINGKIFKTDTASQFALTGALIAAQAAAAANVAYSVDWKVADGTFVTLTEAQVTSAWQTGAAFVSKCFSSEKTVAANVANYSDSVSIVAAFDQAMAS